MAASRSLTSLRPNAQRLALQWHNDCEVAGIDVLVYCTYRGPIEQAALYAQGRRPIAEVNKLRAEAGISKLFPGQNKKIVTKAKPFWSMHQYAIAWDAAPMEAGKIVWNTKSPLWQPMGMCARKLGIEWGGYWTRFLDMPHFQVMEGKTVRQIVEDAGNA